MSETAPAHDKTLAQSLTVIALILVFFAQLTFGSRHLSLTVDEPSHFINGYAILTTGDMWTVPQHVHPPLVNLWSAWPLLLQPERPDPRALSSWRQDFGLFLSEMWPLLGRIERVEWVTRFPIMLLAVLLMAAVYRWARDRFGHWGGVLAIAVMAWDPAMIAHAQLCTTDLGVTLFTFACLFTLDRLLRSFAWELAIGTGLLFGATLASKASGLILAPVVAAVLGWRAMQEMAQKRGNLYELLRTAGRWLACGVLIAAVALTLLWGTYLFEWRALPGFPRPLPLASHIRLLVSVRGDSASLGFLNGRRQEGGWWWYFPFVYAVKTPIPVLIALSVALIMAAHGEKSSLLKAITLWLFPLAYAGIALMSGINVGYRHLLPILPFCYVSIGRLGQWLVSRPATSRWHSTGRWIAATLGAWYVIGTLNAHPYVLAYFNEFIGGPQNGYHHLADSNVDWGQSFKALRGYMRDREIEWVWSSHYTWIDPGAYGVHHRPLPPDPEAGPAFSRPYNPQPGTYAISATTLQGLVVADADTYEWFRHRDPVAQLGYGLLIYDVPAHDAPLQWIAQCNVPQAPLSTDAIRRGFGTGSLRLVQFDCTQSWIYPQGGRSAGQYGIFRETWQQRSGFERSHLASARLSFEQTVSGGVPPFALFEWNGGDGSPTIGVAKSAQAAYAGVPPAQIESGFPSLDLPVELDGPLAFAGYRLIERGREGDSSLPWHKPARPPVSAAELELWTWWQVKSQTLRPLSIMAHLVGADGRPIAVADGSGVLPDQWQVDDILIQRHRFVLPESTPPGAYWLETGAYWLDTMQRWPVVRKSEEIGDGLLLTRTEVNR